MIGASGRRLTTERTAVAAPLASVAPAASWVHPSSVPSRCTHPSCCARSSLSRLPFSDRTARSPSTSTAVRPPVRPAAVRPAACALRPFPSFPSAAVMAQPTYGREDVLMEQFRAIAQRYEINDYFAGKLKQLEGWEIVLILDDSGSMNTPLKEQGPNANAFSKSITRWDELKQTVGIIVDIGAVMDKDGLDLYFLNRATMLNVTSSEQLGPVFAAPASGLTPITPVLQHVLQAKKAIANERKLLIVIATDGAPTNAQGEVDTAALRHVLVSERNTARVHVQFVACTDDNSTVEYLNEWDKKIPNVDVVDDYHSEKAEILKAQGHNFKFSFGDYIVKTLLGSIDADFDRLDESKINGCCTIL